MATELTTPPEIRGTAPKLATPRATQTRKILWPYLIGVSAFHLCLPLVFLPELFSWYGVLFLPLGNYLFCSLGIGAGFHRLLTHRSFACPRWLEHGLALLGVCCLQDSPARWVAIHRMHHQHSDEEPDPHSPHVNWLWGHMAWLMVENEQLSTAQTYDRYARDVLQDPFYLRMERRLLWVWIYAAHALLFFIGGVLVGRWLGGDWMQGLQTGLRVLLWGVIVRTVYTWHVTWCVNSFAHRWGYRNYETREGSRNNWWVALATNGEGWHNNHHAQPRAAAHGHHRWWELDVTYLTLRVLERLGLVRDLVPVKST